MRSGAGGASGPTTRTPKGGADSSAGLLRVTRLLDPPTLTVPLPGVHMPRSFRAPLRVPLFDLEFVAAGFGGRLPLQPRSDPIPNWRRSIEEEKNENGIGGSAPEELSRSRAANAMSELSLEGRTGALSRAPHLLRL